MRRIIALLIDAVAYVVFAATFWCVGVPAYVLTYMIVCSIGKGCITGSAVPYEVFCAAVVASIAMWAAIILLRLIHPNYPARMFIVIFALFTLRFALRETIDLFNGKGGGAYELNGWVRFMLAPAIGCIFGWWLVRRRADDGERREGR